MTAFLALGGAPGPGAPARPVAAAEGPEATGCSGCSGSGDFLAMLTHAMGAVVTDAPSPEATHRPEGVLSDLDDVVDGTETGRTRSPDGGGDEAPASSVSVGPTVEETGAPALHADEGSGQFEGPPTPMPTNPDGATAPGAAEEGADWIDSADPVADGPLPPTGADADRPAGTEEPPNGAGREGGDAAGGPYAPDETGDPRSVEATRTDVTGTEVNGTDTTGTEATVEERPPAPVESTTDTSDIGAARDSAPIHASEFALRRSTDFGAVEPELRDRFERVRDRMKAEFGHDVTVIEGRRSQARQDHLFAQGRTRPGPVVTWTRDSAHTEGHALDVMIDGGFDDTEAYRRLQAVAREEGLKTLGMKDPGHLELASSEDGSTRQSRPGTAERPLRVARVARTASVAQVARVAGPVFDGRAGAATDESVRDLPPEPAPVADPRIAPDDVEVTDIGLGSARTEEVPQADEAAVRTPVVREPSGAGFSLDQPGRAGVPTPRPVSPLTGTPSADQVSRVLEARELAEAASPSRVSVTLGDDAPVRRVNVGILRSTVDAALDGLDAETARVMTARVDELYGALRDRGLELGSVDLANLRQHVGMDAASAARAVDGADELLRALMGQSGDTGSRSDGRPTPQREHFSNRGNDARERRESPRRQQGDTR